MKHSFKFLLPALLILASSCTHLTNQNTPVPVPTGKFSGKFRSIHLSYNPVKYDTVKAQIILTTTSNGNFKITGDTSTVIAGSHGLFALDNVYIQFQDSTKTVAKQAKKHLNGVYKYYYDGTTFQFVASNDTLSHQYDLKRSN